MFKDMFIKYCNKYVDMFEDIVNELLLRVPFPRTIKKKFEKYSFPRTC